MPAALMQHLTRNDMALVPEFRALWVKADRKPSEPNEFLGAGSGFRVAFHPRTPGPKYGGIGAVQEGTFQKGAWVPGRRLNGDETDQGSGWRFSSFQTAIEKCTVYRYE